MKRIRHSFALFVAVLLACMIASAQQAKTPAQSPGKTPGKAAAPKFNPALLKPEELKAEAPATFDVKFTTTKGDFVVRVTREWAPIGADRFYNLVGNGFFDGAHFFRVVPGFVVQFGLNAHPEVSAAWRDARITDDPVIQSNKPGFITYAKSSDPNTRTTQVYINYGDNSRLDAMGFAPFGQVVEGMEIVEKLHGGYGDGAPRGQGPEQGRIQRDGAAYLDKEFPELDKIISARIVPPAPAAPAKKNGQ